MTGVYSTVIVLWVFMSQVMRDGKQAACQSATARIVAYLTKRGRRAPAADIGIGSTFPIRGLDRYNESSSDNRF